uniref:Uncharacterized protein n=1 Tax=Arundo donax TaxID=35708 RepID=A0A0A9ANU1_ARUDO
MKSMRSNIGTPATYKYSGANYKRSHFVNCLERIVELTSKKLDVDTNSPVLIKPE